jgi:uncharacterized integral membrane protein
LIEFLFYFISDVKERSFQSEIVLSAIITMIIYGTQLLLSIKQYRKSMRELYQDVSDKIRTAPKPDEHDIILKSIHYPAFILGYLIGGFVICFNLIFFIVAMFNLIRTQIGSFKWAVESTAPELLVFFLQKIVIGLVIIFFIGYYSQNVNDLRRNRLSVLMLFNMISSKSFPSQYRSVQQRIMC